MRGECVLPDEPETMEGDTADVPGPDADPVYDIGDDTTVIDQGLITVEQLQARIVALPDADALTGMDAEVQAEVYAEVCAIYDAIDEMTDEGGRGAGCVRAGGSGGVLHPADHAAGRGR